MTETDVAPPPGVKPAAASLAPETGRASAAVPPAWRRFIEWFWRGRALAELSSETTATDRVMELSHRASLATRSADLALAPRPSFEHGPARALACELYGQSIAWSLEAQRAAGVTSSDEATRALLADVRSKSFVDLAELDAPAQTELASKLRQAAKRLLTTGPGPVREAERLRSQRALRIGSVLFVIIAGLAVSFVSADWMHDRNDLARGKPWNASSLSYGLGCISPSQTCGGNFFFHTATEPDPWIEIDLGRVLRISSVEIDNRSDCCMERAVPMSIELSTNQKKWKQVAHRKEPFATWSAAFSPSRARYVRLKLKGEGPLHLARIRVFD